MMRRMKRRDIHIFCFWINMLFNYHIACPFIVALTCIWKVTQPKDIPLFSEAQVHVLTILWAVPFYLKVDWTWNNVASDAIFISFFVCALVSPGYNWWPFFALDFQRCCLAVQGMISICHASHWICWVLSFVSSWCWNVIYLFTVVINWRVRGLASETNTHLNVLYHFRNVSYKVLETITIAF